MSSSGAARGGGTIPLQGTAAGRPAANTVAPGTQYWATDTGEFSVTNLGANAWQVLARTSAGTFQAGSNQTQIGNVGGGGQAGIGVVGQSAWIVTGGNLDGQGIGNGLRVAEGANAKQGTYGPLVAGTLAVANTSVTANSRIFVCRSAGGTNPGAHYVSVQTAGTGFTVTSTNAADTGSGVFIIFEPG